MPWRMLLGAASTCRGACAEWVRAAESGGAAAPDTAVGGRCASRWPTPTSGTPCRIDMENLLKSHCGWSLTLAGQRPRSQLQQQPARPVPTAQSPLISLGWTPSVWTPLTTALNGNG